MLDQIAAPPSRQVKLVRVLLAACFLLPAVAQAQGNGAVELERIARRLDLPIGVTHAGDGSGRLFVIQQEGQIVVLEAGGVRAEPFLDIEDRVLCCDERGLLGLAFHPAYETNGFFFVNYTDLTGRTVVARFSATFDVADVSDVGVADPDSETEVLSFSQPFRNHNGGHLAFGPDGFLYIASGDGGSGGDPNDNGQALDTLLGKILRIDVDGLPYAIPPDNPFVGQSNARPEIWAHGLRNPWRFSFDRSTGDLFLGDVGQDRLEEVDFQPAGVGGMNYGWRLMEGTSCFNPSSNCNDGSLILPILEYDHSEGCSVTGGHVYRGLRSRSLAGIYVFGDFCSGTIWAGTPAGNGSWTRTELLRTNLQIASFGEDEDGEVYVVDRAGDIYRLTGRIILADGFESGDTTAWDRRVRRVRVIEPGLDGSAFALSVSMMPVTSMTGATRPSFVRSRAPASERAIRATFMLNANRVDLNGGEVDIVVLRGGGRQHVRLALEQSGKRYRVKLYARGGSGEFELVGRTRIKSNKSVRVGVDWAQASAAGATDGVARLIKGSRVRARTENLANGSLVVSDFRAGLPNGARGVEFGSFLLDEFLITP